jgi:hypothetical protein
MSPFKSIAQRKFLFAKKPTLAKKWADKYGAGKGLPEKLSAKEELKKRISK